jgi:hypothetical protein
MNTKTLNNDKENDRSDAKQAAAEAQEKAAAVAGEAKEQVQDVARRAGSEARGSLADQKSYAAGELHGVAQALRETGSQLRRHDQDMFAEYTTRMADQVDRASTYLEEQSLDDLLADTESFARRQPELFLGGAFTLGLLAARFLKSSAPEQRSDARYYADRPRA